MQRKQALERVRKRAVQGRDRYPDLQWYCPNCDTPQCGQDEKCSNIYCNKSPLMAVCYDQNCPRPVSVLSNFERDHASCAEGGYVPKAILRQFLDAQQQQPQSQSQPQSPQPQQQAQPLNQVHTQSQPLGQAQAQPQPPNHVQDQQQQSQLQFQVQPQLQTPIQPQSPQPQSPDSRPPPQIQPQQLQSQPQVQTPIQPPPLPPKLLPASREQPLQALVTTYTHPKFQLYPSISPIQENVYHTYPPTHQQQPLPYFQIHPIIPQLVIPQTEQVVQLPQQILQTPQPQQLPLKQTSPKQDDQGTPGKKRSRDDDEKMSARPLKKQRLYPSLLPKITKLPKSRAEWENFVQTVPFLSQVDEMIRLKGIWEARTMELDQLRGQPEALSKLSVDELEALQSTLKKALESIEPVKHKKKVLETVEIEEKSEESGTEGGGGCVVS